jgi:succinate dehydrogenase / fumarate reductase cytochrome b subunit
MATNALGGKLRPAAAALPPIADTGTLKKIVMALSGAVLFGFVVVHLLGNLQIYLGRDATTGNYRLDDYSAAIAHATVLKWGVRAVLLFAVTAHVLNAIQLEQRKRQARPVAYKRWRALRSSVPSRTMIYGGVALLAFVIYHLLHFTFGVEAVHPTFQEGHVYENVVNGFTVLDAQRNLVPAALAAVVAYVVAMLALGMHLYHGLWSATQSVGLGNAAAAHGIKRAAAIVAGLIVLGNISIPISVMAGLIQ